MVNEWKLHGVGWAPGAYPNTECTPYETRQALHKLKFGTGQVIFIAGETIIPAYYGPFSDDIEALKCAIKELCHYLDWYPEKIRVSTNSERTKTDIL